MRIIEVITDQGHADTLRGIAEQYQITDIWTGHTDEDGRCSTRFLVSPDKQQTVIDALQVVLNAADNSRLLVLPVEASLPREEENNTEDDKQKGITRSREELYQKVEAGAMLNSNFIYMVMMSTVVAAIGLLADNVAVVIGAMVIAPLLGPNMALAFAATLGDGRLLWTAFKANITGISLALLLSILIGYFWQVNIASEELMSRTIVGIDSIVLALVSGAAAALALTAGSSSSLVGVMVAVALLPPTATVGLMIGTARFDAAMTAALLLTVNIVCVNLAANIVFLLKGIKPRTWFEKQKARQSIIIFVLFWLAILSFLIFVIKY